MTAAIIQLLNLIKIIKVRKANSKNLGNRRSFCFQQLASRVVRLTAASQCFQIARVGNFGTLSHSSTVASQWDRNPSSVANLAVFPQMGPVFCEVASFLKTCMLLVFGLVLFESSLCYGAQRRLFLHLV